VRGVIYSPFGPRHGEHHDGLDLAAPEGSPIVAAADGTVVYAGEQRGYGRIILVAHAGDLVTVYAHNRDNQVRAGDKVVRGQQLATVGRSGNASGPHLHFEVRAGTKPRDPLAMLRP
jgi:murein DD-endopeptidase MepM/ murein hydrolase activator NlpD